MDRIFRYLRRIGFRVTFDPSKIASSSGRKPQRCPASLNSPLRPSSATWEIERRVVVPWIAASVPDGVAGSQKRGIEPCQPCRDKIAISPSLHSEEFVRRGSVLRISFGPVVGYRTWARRRRPRSVSPRAVVRIQSRSSVSSTRRTSPRLPAARRKLPLFFSSGLWIRP